MKAWTSPTLIWPLATRRPPNTATMTKLRLPTNIMIGCIEPGEELGRGAGLVHLLVGVAEPGLDLALAAERLHDGVAGDGLLDEGVELTGVAPLGANRLRERAGDHPGEQQRERDHDQRHQRQQRRDR